VQNSRYLQSLQFRLYNLGGFKQTPFGGINNSVLLCTLLDILIISFLINI